MNSKTIKVNILTNINWPILRQLPSNLVGFEFELNSPEINQFDYIVVYEDINDAVIINKPSNKLILFTGEPPEIKTYSKGFLKQFGTVVGVGNQNHPNLIQTQQSLPWITKASWINSTWVHNPKYNYNYFKKKHPLKKKLLSVISSSKTRTTGHNARLKFIEYLKSDTDLNIDIFGRGINDFRDKWDVTAPYQYHIVLENSHIPHYFTEKLSDSFLAENYVFYSGCTNIFEYFPKQSLIQIDINNPVKTIKTIKTVIDSNFFEKKYSQILEAKSLVLNKYNLFTQLCEIINELDPPKDSTNIKKLYPQKSFERFNLHAFLSK